MSSAIDLPLDILWPRLIAIADEMATTLIRTAFTHDVIEVHDMSTGLYDDRGFLIGQTWQGAVGHNGVMPVFGKSLLAAFPPDTIRPGDVFCCNDPWLANGQTADLFVTTPAFHDGRLLGFSVNSVHHMDIGGRKGSGLSEEVYEEGLIIPHMRLYKAGEPNADLFTLLRRNVRFQEKVIGDIRAQIAAGHVGCEALVAMARDFRLASLRPLADTIIGRTEAGMRAGIAKLTDGVYQAAMPVEVEGIDQALTIALTLTIKGDQLNADFTGTSAQVRRPVNCPINFTRAFVAVPTKLICDPTLPNNEGTYRPLGVTAPDGCLVNPTFPAACFWRLSCGQLVGELMFRCFSQIVPDRVPADSGSVPTWQFYVNGVGRTGRAFALHQHAFGGMGARPGRDGLASVAFPYNVRDVSAEWSEMETPILIERRELITDSGGAGRWRGGLGEELLIRAYTAGDVHPDLPLVLSGSAGRMREPPRGVFGGKPGSYGGIEINGRRLPPTSSPEARFGTQDQVRFLIPGGGGYGDPGQRELSAIAADLRNGYISPEAARREYGYED
ncbi:MAG: hydantoinase B/oxoprolinase family protein [Alphaproteobacteria bacterium]|nr:hydantoinase B/oxoprolinase family protein [Alphaproteobacteria bacterium]